MTRFPRLLLLACTLAGSNAAAAADVTPNTATPRGELLYSTYCIGCHTTQVHWRDRKRAEDWVTLKAEVERWQANEGLGWSEGDIVDVARHLNTLYYHFEPAGGVLSRAAVLESVRR